MFSKGLGVGYMTAGLLTLCTSWVAGLLNKIDTKALEFCQVLAAGFLLMGLALWAWGPAESARANKPKNTTDHRKVSGDGI